MTTPWTITPEWQGQTVAVFASGPSMSQELADQLRATCDRTIAVNGTHVLAPWADMAVSLEPYWHPEYNGFAGMRVIGVDVPEIDALYIGPRWETVHLGPGNIIEIRNSGVTAVRVAALMGAARIVLAGFDYPYRTGHFYDDEVDTGQYPGLLQAMDALVAELRASGVVVDFAEVAAEEDGQ